MSETITTDDATDLRQRLSTIDGITAELDGPGAFDCVTITAQYSTRSVENCPGLHEAVGREEAEAVFADAGLDAELNTYQKKLTVTAALEEAM